MPISSDLHLEGRELGARAAVAVALRGLTREVVEVGFSSMA